jgi:hypothetical protein
VAAFSVANAGRERWGARTALPRHRHERARPALLSRQRGLVPLGMQHFRVNGRMCIAPSTLQLQTGLVAGCVAAVAGARYSQALTSLFVILDVRLIRTDPVASHVDLRLVGPDLRGRV